jgi:DNA-binding response OmpR family regulator
MNIDLTGKNILIVEGSSVAADALRDAFNRTSARVYVTGSMLTAFDLIGRRRFDGAVIDQGLHNEVFDLCEELRGLNVPYVFCHAPHRLQGIEARRRDADHVVWKLHDVMQAEPIPEAHVLKTKLSSEARAD